jgi:hypothetical protein
MFSLEMARFRPERGPFPKKDTSKRVFECPDPDQGRKKAFFEPLDRRGELQKDFLRPLIAIRAQKNSSLNPGNWSRPLEKSF